MNTDAALPEGLPPSKSRLKRYASFFRFLLVGSSNSLMDLLLFLLFAMIFSWNPVVSNVVSTIIVVVISFFLNHRYVFRSDKKRRDTAVQFVTITLISGWGVQSLVIWLVIHFAGGAGFFDHYPGLLETFSKIAAMGVGFMVNYLGYHYIFTSKSSRR